MNSKQRVRAAIERRPVDRVPLGFYVADCDVIGKVIGRKTLVRDKPGIQLAVWQGRRDELVEQFKQDIVDFYRKLDIVDLITYKEAVTGLPAADEPQTMPREIDTDTYELPDGTVYKLSFESNDVVKLHDPTPVPDEYSPADFPAPDADAFEPPDQSRYEVFDYVARELGDDRYIVGPTGGLQCMPLLGGMENGLMMYALCPDAVAAAARRNGAIENLSDAAALRPGVDGVMIEQDMAGTNGLLISPAQWRDISKPVLADRVRHLKRSVDQVILHNCGRNVEIMDDIIECGVDCYQSLQSNAGMSPDVLAPVYGDRLSFWGGAPVELLIDGTPDEMRRATREVLEATAETQGFIFGPSHSIAFGTKYDTFMAMLDELDRRRARS
jgi:hypothetical protein